MKSLRKEPVNLILFKAIINVSAQKLAGFVHFFSLFGILQTPHPFGREMGIKAGANVVMPNLSPSGVRSKYALYDNKLSDGSESAQCKAELSARMEAIGYEIVTDRGDIKKQICK